MVAVWGSGVRGRDGEAPTRGEKGGEELGRDAWVPREAAGEAGGGLRPPTVAAAPFSTDGRASKGAGR